MLLTERVKRTIFERADAHTGREQATNGGLPARYRARAD